MKIKEGYLLSEVAGTAVVVPVNPDHTFRNMMKLNATGKLLWEALLTETTKEALVSLLVAEYEIDADVASVDVESFLATLRTYGVLAE